MRRQLRTDDFPLSAVNFFQRAGNSPVQKPPPDRTQLTVRDLTQTVVGKVVRFGALPFDDAALPQLFECAGHAVLVPVGCPGQQIKGERSPDGARQAGQFVSG